MDWEAAIRAELEPMVPYAPGLRASEVRERSGRETILKLSSNEHPCGPFPAAIEAMEAVLPHLNRYPDGSARALRKALCHHLDIADENLVVGNGSNEIIRLIAQAVLRPGDEVVFAWPSFVVYPMVTQMFGATAVKVPLDSDETRPSAMLEAITERTRIVFLCNPNNPTGTIYRSRGVRAFHGRGSRARARRADEAYFEFVTDDAYPDALEWFDGQRPLVVLRTFSKIYSLAGLRIGYGALPAALAAPSTRYESPST
jgi:histidinol-phosphate aminotransferase